MTQSCCSRMQLRCGGQLLAKIGRSVDQEPVFAVGADRNRCLSALRPTVACRLADRTTAIPLWNAAACRGSQNDDAQHDSSPGRFLSISEAATNAALRPLRERRD